MRRTTMLVVCTLTLALCAVYASAQTAPAPDTLKVDYFSNANTSVGTGAGVPVVPDATVRITNPGTSGGTLCADVFVFDPYEEMSECCPCQVTPNGLVTLSVDDDLTSNPLTDVYLTTGSLYIISTATKDNYCPLPFTPTAGVRAWATHIQNVTYAITETPSQDATLSSTELARIENECESILNVGSGHGLCDCGGYAGGPNAKSRFAAAK
jgi:hypothetical protein